MMKVLVPSVLDQRFALSRAFVCLAGAYEDTRDTPNSAPCPIINIKKEYRETEEETKEILRKLESDRVSVCLLMFSLAHLL